ncbi:uncharacterized protein LOC106162547 [Lingula anatina]|uniref:Uncharacterized protein LOC106162547 n=1 Tax=Lingula anatina TaxID=7574 RepID=A0A1S3IBS7_LINAN|nr:uncharacterized protein LOC106162547 [Lingula anatina]XP_013395316.1 uncharacterized protein LOC106162547 [Lingula anatina]|eukprot:XP_013395315.1 uncharacterized protein LOC106162547 [Lingula anatina]
MAPRTGSAIVYFTITVIVICAAFLLIEFQTKPVSKLASIPPFLKCTHFGSRSSAFLKNQRLEDTGTAQDSLLKQLKEDWVFEPSKKPYNLSRPNRQSWSQIGQAKLVDGILKQRRNGFFVESGAADGEGNSNSLFFEISRGWEGLLVEPNPWSFKDLLKKNRKAYAVNSCLATSRFPAVVPFTFAKELGGISGKSYKLLAAEQHDFQGMSCVHCFPILSLLAAVGRNHVDYFSLDVEGAEIEILRSFPWNQVTVDVWTIEYAVHGGSPDTPRREKAIRKIFEETGLYKDGTILGGQDIVFVRKNI